MKSNSCNECSSVIDSDFIKSLQNQIYSKLAKQSNTESASRRYDLGCKVDTENFKNLTRMDVVLNNVLSCNECMSGYTVEQLVSLSKRLING